MNRPSSSINNIFNQNALERPDTPAVFDGGRQITYRQLDDQSNRLARWIEAESGYDFSTDNPIKVPLCLNQGIERIEVILAILKLGGAYVPIDPDFPDSRIEFILRDIDAKFIITNQTQQQRLQPILDSWPTLSCIDIDRQSSTIAAQSNNSSLNAEPGLESIAYVMYTSGTTGNPKGVLVTHQAVTRLVIDTNYIHIRPEDCFSQLSNIAFDASTFEIWGALLNGARIAMINKETALNPHLLQKAIADYGITIAFMTTGLFNQHITSNPDTFKGLRCLLFGGEAASTDIVRQLFRHPDCPSHLLHVYGPTENTTFSTCYEIKSLPKVNSPLPIGKPISNSDCILVDDELNIIKQTDSKQVGELLVSGPGLALGYLNRDDLTNEKFIHLTTIDERQYRTGDIVGRLDSGDYYFIGRVDNQVKIRGFRIELDEIEMLLNQHTDITAAAIHVKDQGAGKTRQLIAYLQADNPPAVSDIRDFLKQSLPAYMLPSQFYRLDSFPLSSSGKVDRKEMLNCKCQLLIDNFNETQECNVTEQMLLKIWAECLHLLESDISIDEDFFVLGGDSLLAIQILSEIYHRYQLELPSTIIFEHSNIRALAAYVDSHETASDTEIKPWDGSDFLPLTPYQAPIWLHQQQGLDYPYYNEPLSITIHHRIDPDLMQQALALLFERHEALRCRFVIRHSTICHKIIPPANKPADFGYYDMRALPLAVATQRAESLATQAAIKPFNLATDELMRYRLVRFSDDLYKLYMTFHHLIIDGVTVYQVFLPELKETYSAVLLKQTPQLEKLPFSYCDWLVWQHENHKCKAAEDIAYWRDRLTGMTAVQLPTDKTPPAQSEFTGARECLEIPEDTSRDLRGIASQHGASLFMVLLTAFKVLLNRYTRQQDLTIATALANRNIPGSEKLVGNFVNTLLIRNQLPDQASFSELLQMVKHSCLGAYTHSRPALHEVLSQVDSLEEEKHVNIAFVLEPTSSDETDWELSQLDIHTNTSKFDLTVELDERHGAVIGRIEYSTERFHQETIQKMIKYYLTLLNAVIESTECDYHHLDILTPEERRIQLYSWNDTAVDYEGENLLHKIIERQVDYHPDATAIIFNDESITFSELDKKANQLAAYLLEQGVKTEDAILVWVDRSIEHMVAIFAVLKAGAAYVPIGTTEPIERIDYMRRDTAAQIIICDDSHDHQIELAELPLIKVNLQQEQPGQHTNTRPVTNVKSTNLAYIIYTSGSSGKPKGVLIEHRHIATRSHWAAADFNLGPGDVFLHLFSLSFDAAVVPSWWSLNQGAAVLIPDEQTLMNPAALYSLIEKHQVTVIVSTPGIMTTLVEKIEKNKYSHLKILACGGESLSNELCHKMNQNAPSVKNLYGPTEATVLATIWDTKRNYPLQPPIGIPVANTSLYVMNETHQLMPPGIPGELYIGGGAIARGYLNQPELNSRHFIKDPFSEDPSARLYRTGDIVRFLDSGEVVYLGRADNQVKIRGFRIELGEIESVIRQQKAIDEAIVVAKKNRAGLHQVLAYYTGSNAPDGRQLRKLLEAQLPPQMLPTVCFKLDHLPLNRNGKIDQRALPEPEHSDTEDTKYQPPNTATEQLLTDIWSGVLGINKIGRHDDFYSIGGDSLASLQVVCRAEEQGIPLSISELLELRSIAEIAKHHTIDEAATQFGTTMSFMPIENSASKSVFAQSQNQIKSSEYEQFFSRGESVSLLKSGSEKSVFLIHPSGVGSNCYHDLSSAINSEHSIYCVESDLHSTLTIEAKATSYVNLIRDRQKHGPYIVGGWSLGGIIALEVCCQLEAAGECVELLLIIDSLIPGNDDDATRFKEISNDKALLVAMAASEIERITNIEFNIDSSLIYQQQQPLEWFFEFITKRNLFKKSFIDNFVKPFIDNYQNKIKMLYRYQPGQCQAPIMLFVAHDMSTTTKCLLQHYPGIFNSSPDQNWQTICQSVVSTHIIPGKHEDLVYPPCSNHIAEPLNRVLDSGSIHHSKVAAFQALSHNDWKILLHSCRISHFNKGDILIHEGANEHNLMFVSKGFLDVFTETQIISTVGPNTVIGELSFIDGGPRSASIKAFTDGQVYILTPDAFEKLAEDFQTLGLLIHKDISKVLSSRFRTMRPANQDR